MSKPVPILLYHCIADDAAPRFRRWAVRPEVFATHVKFLHEHGYMPLTVSQFVRAASDDDISLPERPIVLTFDDGFADFHTNALPVLTHHDFVATLYLTVGFIGDSSRWLHCEGEEDRPMLTWDQVAEVNARGVECGAHAYTHPQLDIIPIEVARDEILRSKEVLEERLRDKVRAFAYPYGCHNAAVRELVQQAGYSSACAVRCAISSTTDNRFALARILVPPGTDEERLSALLSGRDLPSPAVQRAKTRVRRLIRRLSS